MAKLELKLHTEKGDATYTEDHVSGQKYLDLLTLITDLDSKMGKITQVESIEAQVNFIAGLFSHQDVTPEAILKGVDAWDLMATIERFMGIILGTKSGDQKKEQPALETLENNI